MNATAISFSATENERRDRLAAAATEQAKAFTSIAKSLAIIAAAVTPKEGT